MSVPQNWRRIDRNDLRDFPASVEKLTGPLNSQVEEVTTILQGRVGSDNIDMDGRLLFVKHGVESKVKLKTSQKPVAGSVVYADNYPLEKPTLSWAMAGEKTVRFTCYFRKADGSVDPAGQANVRLEFRV